MTVITLDASYRDGWCVVVGVSDGELLFRTILPADTPTQAERLALTHGTRAAEALGWDQVTFHTDLKPLAASFARRPLCDSSGMPRERWQVKFVPRHKVAAAHRLALSELRVWLGGDQ